MPRNLPNPKGELVCCSTCGRDTRNRSGVCSPCFRGTSNLTESQGRRSRKVESHPFDEDETHGPSDEGYHGGTLRDDI